MLSNGAHHISHQGCMGHLSFIVHVYYLLVSCWLAILSIGGDLTNNY